MLRQVLLVDAPSARTSQRVEVLRTFGFHVWLCATAAAAKDYALRRAPEIILMADGLADEERYALLASLRFDPRTNPLAIVLEESAPSLALTIEPDARLSPQVRRSMLLQTLAVAVAQAERRRQHLLRSELTWRLLSSPVVLEQFAEPFATWTQQTGLSAYAARQLAAAVQELCANAMEWGHRFRVETPVYVTARLDEEKVSVLVRDSGPGFNRQHLPHAARPGDPVSHRSVRQAANLREGGFGILMASGLVDQLAYNERGNEALVVKYLPATLTHPSRANRASLLASG